MNNISNMEDNCFMERPYDKRLHLLQLPTYSVAEVTHYLKISKATIYKFIRDRNDYLYSVYASETRPIALSFLELIDLHLLSSIRRKFMLPTSLFINLFLRFQTNDDPVKNNRYYLTCIPPQTGNLDLLIDKYLRSFYMSKVNKSALHTTIQAAFRRIKLDARGNPAKLYPFIRNTIDDETTIILIDPSISSGRPVLVGTGLSTEIITERFKAGETVGELAKDYKRDTVEIEEAIRWELHARRR